MSLFRDQLLVDLHQRQQQRDNDILIAQQEQQQLQNEITSLLEDYNTLAQISQTISSDPLSFSSSYENIQNQIDNIAQLYSPSSEPSKPNIPSIDEPFIPTLETPTTSSTITQNVDKQHTLSNLDDFSQEDTQAYNTYLDSSSLPTTKSSTPSSFTIFDDENNNAYNNFISASQQQQKSANSNQSRHTTQPQPLQTTELKDTVKPILLEPFGDNLTLKHKHASRFLLNNSGGLYCSKGMGKARQAFENFENAKVDFWSSPESHAAIGSDGTKNLTELFHTKDNNGTITHSNTTPDKTTSANTQAGGITSCVSQELTRKLGTIKQDSLGRWHVHHIFTKKGILAVYSCYRPNHGSTNNYKSAWTLQREKLLQRKIETFPEQQFVLDISEAIRKDLKKDFDILVLSDANDHRGKNSTPYLDAMSNLGLINILEEKYGVDLPPTHLTGSNPIDHIHCTPDIFDAILSVGILPLGAFVDSDHRGIFLDLDKRKIYSPHEEKITFYDKRRLKSTDIKKSNIYNNEIERQCLAQKVEQRITKLQNLIDTNAPEIVITALIESLDKQLHEIMMAAEKHLPNVHTMYWTPEVSEMLKRLYAINKQILKLKAETKKRKLNNKEKIKTLNSQRQEIRDWFNTRSINAKDIRQKFLDDLAKSWTEEGKFKDKTVAVKVLKNIEVQKRESKLLSSVLKPFEEGGLTYILIPNKCEYNPEDRDNYMDPDTIWKRIEIDQGKDIKDWIPVTLKKDMETLLLAWQQLHFKQASTTQLASPEWVQQLKTATKREDIKELMNSQKLNEPTKALLDELFKRQDNDTDYTLKFEDFKAFVEKKDERTSASPSGRHYGHLKSIKNTRTLKLIFFIIQTSLKYQYIPSRWKKTNTTLVPKKTGDPKIHRLRPIHIIEPEIQFISNHFWSNLFMKKCEKLGLITDSQYGGRSGRQPQNAMIKQNLIWDIIKLQNRNAASHVADARANFDRNMSHIVGHALISLNMAPDIVKYYQLFLSQQIYTVRTSYGTTEETYTYDPEDPYFGDGQGIGWSSVNQIVISSIIDSVYNSLAPMFQLTSIDGMYKIFSGINFFIDDRISNTISESNNMNELVQQFQQNETLQVDLLNPTGGAVAPKKCTWWPLKKKQGSLNFEFDEDVEHYSFALQNIGDDHAYNIDCMSPDEAEKYLGAFMAPTMDPTKQIKELRKEITTWSNKLTKRRVPKKLVPKAYNEYLVPKMAHPLVVCDISFEEADDLMKIIRKTLGEKSGYHTKTQLDIQHGPIDYFGEAIRHIYDIAGEEKLAFLFAHLRNGMNKNDTVAEAIYISLLDHMLWLGVFDNVFNLDFDKWHPILGTRSWIISIWRYLHHTNNELDIADLPTYELPFKDDFFIMKHLMDHEKDIKKIIMFNKVRVHYKLLTASDLVTGNGRSIHPSLLNRKTRDFKERSSTFSWPQKEFISDKWRNVFIELLNTHFREYLKDHSIGKQIEGRTSHQTLNTSRYDDTTLVSDSFVYRLDRNNRYRRTHERIPTGPCTMIDATIENHHTIRPLPSLDRGSIEQLHLLSDNIIEDAPAFLRNIWGILEITKEDLEELRPHLKNAFIVVTDGGNPPKQKYSTYAWAIAKPDGTILFINGGAVGGLELDQDSFRAECYGAYAARSFINYLEKNGFEVTNNRKFYCDNKTVTELVHTSFLPPSKSIGKKSHYDIRVQLCHELHISTCAKTTLKVKGHMDRVKPFHKCLPEEKVNILVDRHCDFVHKKIQAHPELHPPLVSDFLPHQKVSIRSTTHRLVKKSFMEAHETSRIANLTEYLCNKLNITDSMYHLIDWHALNTFATSHSQVSRRKYQKILYRKWITQRQRFLMKQVPNQLCTMCGQETETFTHIHKCQHDCMTAAHESAEDTFRETHLTMETPIALVDLLLEGIENWDVSKNAIDDVSSDYPFLHTLLTQAVADQKIIGWDLALSGLIASSWLDVIARFFDETGMTERRPKTWSRKLIGSLLDYSHLLWKARCNHLKATGQDYNSNFKQSCKELHTELLQDPEQLGRFQHHLDKSSAFFRESSKELLELWKYRVSNAIRQTKQECKKNQKNTLHRVWGIQLPTLRRRPPASRTTRLPPRVARERKNSRLQNFISKCKKLTTFFPTRQIPLQRPTDLAPTITSPDAPIPRSHIPPPFPSEPPDPP